MSCNRVIPYVLDHGGSRDGTGSLHCAKMASHPSFRSRDPP